ncbi:MAG: hypothetical protein LQ352_001818 [Teloschistes flavicans]|nr:MAG: hypothetical protein LQ352_001818 [Teloschistes flavicans]
MLSILRKARFKDKELRVLMLGLDNAGKTTIVKRLLNEDVNSVSPTLGFIIRTMDYEGWVFSQVMIYYINSFIDAGTSSTFKTLRTYWRNYFEKTDALIWVVDSADRDRAWHCRQELAGLLLEEVRLMLNPGRASLMIIQRLMGASLLVFANKSDIEGSMSVEEIRKSLALDAIKTHNWTIKQCSATEGLNVQEGIQWVVQDAKERLFLY